MLAQDIKDAQFVLTGIGSEMQVTLQALKKIRNFSEKLSELEEDKEKEWLRPFLIRYYLRKEFHPEIVGAYERLKKLLEEKDYYIVSLSTDDLIREIGFKKDRMVMPCGTYDALQCENNCTGKLFSIEENFWAKICGWIENKASLEELKEPKCPECGAALVVNQYGQPKYNEEGYMKNWQNYTKWLQGTLNRKLCIIELGAGMEFPNIIRWPFEKVCFYNQKSSFWRIHSSLYQLSEEIEMRGKSVRKDPVIFLNELCK